MVAPTKAPPRRWNVRGPDTEGMTSMPEQDYKQCSCCAAVLARSAFNRLSSAPDGLQRWCRDCQRARHNAWWRANLDGATKRRERHKRRHPDKARARKAVHNAVFRGTLAKPESCGACGAVTEKRLLHGHHADYSKPLEVEWLCRKCHESIHDD